MEISVRGWRRDHGATVLADRDLLSAKMGSFEEFFQNETYVSLSRPDAALTSFSKSQDVNQEPSVSIHFDAKIVLNGEYLARVKMSRGELSRLFFALNSNRSIVDVLEDFNSVKPDPDLASLQVPLIFLTPVSGLDLSSRAQQISSGAGAAYLGDLVQKTEAELLRVPSCGRKSLLEIKEKLASLDLHLGMEISHWPPENLEVTAEALQEYRRASRSLS